MSTTIKLRRSAVPGRVPTPAQLELGEIAINTADGKIFIKQYDAVSNTSNVVEYSADPNDLLDLIKTVDGAGSGLDADTLDGEQGSYFLDYNNFTNTPANTNILESIRDVDGAGSGLDADFLDGLDSTQFLRSDEDDTFSGDLTITGNLTVTGNTTYVNTEEILLSDNVIVLNANFTGPTASENAGIEVERGGESNVVLQWNETQNYWEIASGGITGRILTTGDEGSGNGLDADTLDGQEGTYYLDFTNFTSLPDPQIDVNITGKVTGTGTTTLTNLGNGTININAELANTAVTPGTYGTASQIPIITVDEDGRLTAASNVAVAGVDSLDWYTSNNTLEIRTVDGNIFQQDIDTFGGTIDVTDIVVTGTVDGRDVSVDGAKLDGIEAGATGDMSNTEILEGLKTVDGTGSGLDSDLLDGQEGTYYLDFTNATNKPDPQVAVTLSGKVTGTGSTTLTDLGNGSISITTELTNTGVTASTYGTATLIPVITVDEDGRLTNVTTTAVAGVDSTDWYSANNTYQIVTGDGSIYNTVINTFSDITTGNITTAGTVDGRDLSVDGAKLDGIEPGATGDQTASEILTAIKTVDGTGSGLDADLLDGLNSTQFLRSDEDDTFTGDLTISGNLIVQGTTTTIDTETILLSDNIITLNSNFTGPTATQDAGIEVERGDETNVVLQWNETQNYWEIASGGVTGRILTTGDEGSGNGLDSDTLDGQQGTYYLDYDNFTNTPTDSEILTQVKNVDGTGSGLDADLLDGQQGTYYLDYSNFSNTPSNTALLNSIKDVDGTGSGLDADLLDGQQGSYYLDFTNATNKPDPQIDLTLSGKVTGSGSTTLTDLGNGSLSITTELSNTGVSAATYGSALEIPILTVDEDGRITTATTATLQAGAVVTSTDWYSSNNTFNITLSNSDTFNAVISQFDANVDFGAGIDVTGNITVTGLVDGRDIAADGTKLDNIEPNATADQTPAEILAALLTVDGTGSGLDADLLDGDTKQDIIDAASAQAGGNVGNATITIDAGTALNGGGTFTANQFANTTITVNHADTSSVTNVNNSGGTVLQDIFFDTHGHVTATGSVNLDSRYYTETEVDNTFVPQTTQVIAGTALTGGGALTGDVTINHGDTSTQASVSNINGTVIQSIALDDHGHLTSISSANLDTRYYTETELNNGQLDNRYYTETEIDGKLDLKANTATQVLAGDGLTGGGSLTGDVTISHADTSSVTDVSTTGKDVISSITFDEFGHVTARTTRTLDFISQSEADARYVNVDGDTMTGDLTVQADIIQDHAAYVTASATTSSTTGTNILSFNSTTYNSAEVIVTATQGINRHITKLLIVHNGTTASATEFGTIYTNTSLASYDVSISGSDVVLTVTAASGTSTEYKIAATLLID